MTRFRSIAVLMLLSLVTTEASGQLLSRFRRPSGATTQRSASRTNGRQCQSPWCLMCALNHGPIPGYAIRGNRVVYVGFGTKPSKPDPIKAELAATPQAIVDVMLLLARLTPDDRLLDPGCGDARFLVTAAQRYDCLGIGVEIDSKTADAAEANVKAAGFSDKILIVRGDSTKHKLGVATVVVCYLFPETIEKVFTRCPNARMWVSYMHEIPGVQNKQLTLPIEGQEHRIYFWTRE